LIYTDQNADAQRTEEERAAIWKAYEVYSADVYERGVAKDGAALQPATTATTVKVRNGDLLRTDGPYAETKEQLGGYYIVECADLDEAIELASKLPSAAYGSIEVRPLVEFG
jgi:hypothetical protein